jgi:hypothetical protein
MARSKTRFILIWEYYLVEEREKEWWFRSAIDGPWVGPYPSFAALAEQIGNHIEKQMIYEYRKKYGKTPK